MMCMFPALGRLCEPSLHVQHHILHAIAHGVGIVTQAGPRAIGQPQWQQWLREPGKACRCEFAQHSVTGVQPAWCGPLPLYCPDTYATVCTHCVVQVPQGCCTCTCQLQPIGRHVIAAAMHGVETLFCRSPCPCYMGMGLSSLGDSLVCRVDSTLRGPNGRVPSKGKVGP